MPDDRGMQPARACTVSATKEACMEDCGSVVEREELCRCVLLAEQGIPGHLPVWHSVTGSWAQGLRGLGSFWQPIRDPMVGWAKREAP